MPVVEVREPLALQMEYLKEVQGFLREKKELPMAGGGYLKEEVEPVLEKRLHYQKMQRGGSRRILSYGKASFRNSFS